jgi:hypothetical protein
MEAYMRHFVSLVILVLTLLAFGLVGYVGWWFLAPEATHEVTTEQTCDLELRHGKYSGFRFYARCPNYSVWIDDIDHKSGLKDVADGKKYKCVFVIRVGDRTGWQKILSHSCTQL